MTLALASSSPFVAAGVDVGKLFLDVAVARPGDARKTKSPAFRAPNGAEGIARIVARLREHGVVKVVLESVGAYGARLVRELSLAGFEVGVVDPRRIRALRLAEGGRAKNDKLDARLIARFALSMAASIRPVLSPEALELRALSTRRRQLVEMIAMEKTRLKQSLGEAFAASHRRIIAQLEEEVAAYEAEIDARIRADGQGARRLELLKTIPGVGDKIAATLLADLPEVGTLGRKEIASLSGVAPHISQSGRSAGVAQIQGGRPCVRAALYLAALSSARCESGFRAEYQAMRAAGKPAKVALIAIARRLVTVANAMLKEDRPWERPPAAPAASAP